MSYDKVLTWVEMQHVILADRVRGHCYQAGPRPGQVTEEDALEIVREALRSTACASIGESMDLINCQMPHPKEVHSQIRTDRAARRARSRRRG